jgi:uncharacterized membrane protein YhhN
MMATMPPWLPFLLGMMVAVALVLRGERTGQRVLVWVFKPLASAMFVAIGWLLYASPNLPGSWILLALLLCLAGDVLLMIEGGLLPGLVAFLLGHVAYVAAFHAMAPAHTWPVVLSVPVVVASALATRWLWPHLGKMRGPVLAYVTVITVMVWAAAGVADAGVAPLKVLAGAVLFYLSDLSVARDRFVRKAFVNRAWGLPAYYLGQLLLALSVAR